MNRAIDFNEGDAFGDTPLHLAARKGHYRTVVLLLTSGLDVDVFVRNHDGLTAEEVTRDEHIKLLLATVRQIRQGREDIREGIRQRRPR